MSYSLKVQILHFVACGGQVTQTTILSEDDVFHFDVSLLVPELQSQDRLGAIKELVDRLYGRRKVVDSLKFLQTILDREDQMSTVLGRGVALPHARCRSVAQPGVALGISQTGIAFPPDAEPVHVICMVAVPDVAPVPYLSVLSNLALLFKNSDVRAGLMACDTSMSMYQFMTKHLAQIRKMSAPHSVL